MRMNTPEKGFSLLQTERLRGKVYHLLEVGEKSKFRNHCLVHWLIVDLEEFVPMTKCLGQVFHLFFLALNLLYLA